MSESIPCDNPKRFVWLRRLLGPIDSWLDTRIWWRVAEVTQRHRQRPGFSRFFAGISEFAWIKYCGYGWKFAARCGLIYWGWVKVAYDETPLPVELGEHLGKPAKCIERD